MARPQAGGAWPNVLVFLLCVVTPTLGLLVWVLGNRHQRPIYLRSWWVRIGLVALVVGATPLLTIGLAAKVGLWPDPNPNPIGAGLLFTGLGLIATVCLAIGAVWVWLELRRAAT